MSTRLVMYRGDDRSFPMTLTADSAPIDLTDATVRFTCRDDLDDDTAMIELTSDDDGVEIDPDQVGVGKGKITVNIPSSATADFETSKTLLCDVEITDSDGNKRTAPEPDLDQSTLIRLTVRRDVTHA